MLNSIDEMVKSDRPYEVFQKYRPLYMKLSNVDDTEFSKEEEHEFFI